MSDVTLSYKGSDILELSDSGSATLKTGGTYCEADIEVEYVKPSGGNSSKTHFHGTISFTGEDIHSFAVPLSGVTLTSDMYAVGIARVIKTGEIVDGEIEWYEHPQVPAFSTSSNVGFAPMIISWASYLYTPTIYYQNGTANSQKTVIENRAYRMWDSNNGGNTGGGQLAINTSNNTISLHAQSQWLCRTSCATVYEYDIFIFTKNGEPLSISDTDLQGV